MMYSDVRIFLCTTPTNMNYSFDRLMGRAQEIFDQDPTSGHLFLFLNRDRDRTAAELPGLANGQPISVAGLVITKQRPGTASGVTFVTLEDETGYMNLVVWKAIAERDRATLLNAKLMGVRGEVQIEGRVIHVVARQLVDHSGMLGNLLVKSRDFR